MRRIVRVATLVLPLLALGIVALTVPAQAQQPVFPNEGTIGLVPPEGMSEIPNMPGLQDRAAKASILLLELPQQAYKDITADFAPAELQKQGVTVEERRDVDLADGIKAVLLKGYQSVPNASTTLKKWILIAGGKQQTGMIMVQFPEEASARYPDATVEAALKTVVMRTPPSPEQMIARLPFTFADMEGYKVFRVMGSSAVLLTQGDSKEPDPATQPFFIVAAGPGEVREEERESVARRAIASVPGVKELRVERGGPLRIGGQPGYELIASAMETLSGKPVKVVQWLRFGRTANLRMVGVAPASRFDADFTAMRGLRDGIELR